MEIVLEKIGIKRCRCYDEVALGMVCVRTSVFVCVRVKEDG